MLDNPCTDYHEHDRLMLGAMPNGRDWELLGPFRVEYAFADGRAGTLPIPAGYMTDLSSSPPGCRNIVAKIGRHAGPSVAHDYCYDHAPVTGLSREDADWLFLRGMEVRGYPWWRRIAAFVGVRLGGWRPWSRHEDERAAAEKVEA